MNKQEAIEKLQGLKQVVEEGDKGSYNKGLINALTYALNVTKQLDEPEKPVVPQFVADWYEAHAGADFEYSLYRFFIDFHEGNLDDNDLQAWFTDNSNKPIQTIVNMHQFDYEVEKEKLYTVKFANEDFGKIYIGIFKKFNKLGISSLPLNDDEVKSWFTEDELKRFKFWDNPAFDVNEVK